MKNRKIQAKKLTSLSKATCAGCATASLKESVEYRKVFRRDKRLTHISVENHIFENNGENPLRTADIKV